LAGSVSFQLPIRFRFVINERYAYLWILEKRFAAAPGMLDLQVADSDYMEEGTFIVITDPSACVPGTKPQLSKHNLLRDAVRNCFDTARSMNVKAVAGRLIREYPLDF
jgi:hypothetical protein